MLASTHSRRKCHNDSVNTNSYFYTRNVTTVFFSSSCTLIVLVWFTTKLHSSVQQKCSNPNAQKRPHAAVLFFMRSIFLSLLFDSVMNFLFLDHNRQKLSFILNWIIDFFTNVINCLFFIFLWIFILCFTINSKFIYLVFSLTFPSFSFRFERNNISHKCQ